MSDILNMLRDTDPPVIHHTGWDCFITAPGLKAEVRCRVCGEVMAVKRGVVGPTGLAHAMAIKAGVMKGVPHDEFTCIFSQEAWHRQALALKMEASRTASSGLAKMLLDEAEQLIRARTATKEVPGLP